MSVTFFDILGIDPNASNRDTLAASLLPNDVFSLTSGLNAADDRATIVQLLQAGLSFTNVRPGVDAGANVGTGLPGQISFAADVHVTGSGLLTSVATKFYLRALPDTAIQLIPTDPDPPAQMFVSVDSRGTEIIIDRLPVKLFLKPGLATSLDDAVSASGEPFGMPFPKNKVDGFAYVLHDQTQSSEIDVIVRLHLLPNREVIVEASVPISFGPVRFMGLPTKNVYDLQLIASPAHRELYEWTHNNIGSFISNPPVKGALGFRSIELDWTQEPLKHMLAHLQRQGSVYIDSPELVLEDVVIPLSVPMLPIPSHGTFGIRRKIADRGDIVYAYTFTDNPLQIPIYCSDPQGGGGGSSLTLEIEKFFFRAGELGAANPNDAPQIQFQAALIFGTSHGNQLGPTVGIDDDWTITAGMEMSPQTTPLNFTIAHTTVSLIGFKFGVSAGRLARKMPFGDSYEALGDILIASQPDDPNSDSKFKLESATGTELKTLLRDVGYKLGHWSLGSLQMPDGMKLVFGKSVSIIIEEFGWVEESNGTPYFSFSGGVAVVLGASKSEKPKGDAKDTEGNGFGIRVRRLRFRLNDDDTQPPIKIDGIFLTLHAGIVQVDGFGYISDFTDSGWAIKEWGFGVKVALKLTAMTLNLAAEFIRGSRRHLTTGDAFDYFLAGFELSTLPAGPYTLYDLRALLADNMAPNLESEYPDGEGMVLLAWNKDHNGALSMPRSRQLDDWIAEKGAFSVGVGCGFSLSGAGSAFHIDVFVFFAKTPVDSGLLVVGELYLLKNLKPVAFVAIEYDFDTEKFGVMAGVDMALADFISSGVSVPDWLRHIATLTGTIYFGNKPWALAIGQLADQSSWLSLNIGSQALGLAIRAQLAVCVQIVDGGPKGFGLVFTIRAGADWGVGTFIVFGSFGFIFGVWKTGSRSVGMEFWAAFGFKINLFWVFSFGAEIAARIIYLGNHWSLTLHAEIRIDTPWYLPDVTVSFDKTLSEPMPFDTATITQFLSGGSGIEPAAQRTQPLQLPGLGGALGDASYLYTFNELCGRSGTRIADTHAQSLPVVSVDATIVIDFSQPVSNDALIATSTYDGVTDAGVQKVQDITVRYGLSSIAIRRAPRFGPTAGVWSDFITDAQTGFSIGGAAPQTLTFTWDHDTRADGKVAPKRLLVNSSAPYSFVTQAAQSDEESIRNDPDFPCCNDVLKRAAVPKPRVLQFKSIPFGTRTPQSEKFSGENGAWWRWSLATPPAVAPGDPVFPGEHVARFSPRTSGAAGYADLADPAYQAQLELSWESFPGKLFFEAYAGLKLLAQQIADLHKPGSATLSLSVGNAPANGITRLLLRVELDSAARSGDLTHLDPGTRPLPGLAGIGVFRISYTTLADALRYAGIVQRCRNGGLVGPPGSDAAGKLAFLPNHDYEIVVTGTVALGTPAQGTRTMSLSEAAYFRTKGLPGLNACANVGDDIRSHVATTYAPRRDIPLYREEPCVLAFENSLSAVLPIDRAPAAGDPPEKAQMFPLILNVDRVVSLDGLKRLTVPGDDWILAHRANPYPARHVVAEPSFAKSKVRLTQAHDPLVTRFETVKSALPACGPQTLDHASQVLLHEPIGADGAAGSWEAATGYRATVRQKNGPFAERSGFDTYDLGAFICQADGGAGAALWSIDTDGKLVAPNASVGRFYAAVGETGWDHLQVHSRIDLRTANAAGIAVGVGNGSLVPQAVIATIESAGGATHALVLRLRDGTGEHELVRTDLALSGAALLTVVAFDDIVRATVGETSVEAPRGAVREGRVALVADGPAAFAGIAVDALDIYAFEFLTSKYASFGEHLDSYDGMLPVLATGAFGGNPSTGAAVLAANGAQIAPVMQRAADPQERQRLFGAFIAALGLGVQSQPSRVAISRLTDNGGTFGFLVESPEPISLTRDVSLVLTYHVRTWVWDSDLSPSQLPLSPSIPVPAASGPTFDLPFTLPGATPAPDISITTSPPSPGHWDESDVPVPFVALSNGAETSILILSPNGVPFAAGKYTLRAVMDRDRWQTTGAPDTEQHYHQERSITLQW